MGHRITGEAQGQRVILQAQVQNAVGTDWLFPCYNAFSSVRGFCMPRAGSIVGLSANIDLVTFNSAMVATINLLKNNATVFSVVSANFAGAGQQNIYATQARGVDTFVAGDILHLYYSASYTGNRSYIIACVELQFDT